MALSPNHCLLFTVCFIAVHAMTNAVGGAYVERLCQGHASFVAVRTISINSNVNDSKTTTDAVFHFHAHLHL